MSARIYHLSDYQRHAGTFTPLLVMAAMTPMLILMAFMEFISKSSNLDKPR